MTIRYFRRNEGFGFQVSNKPSKNSAFTARGRNEKRSYLGVNVRTGKTAMKERLH
jgi:hypothetical protein